MSRAQDDLSVAETLTNAASPPWAVCYHVQQAVEKGMKALLVFAAEDPPKSHNLVRLNSALDPPLFPASAEDGLASLTLWAVDQRYPADQPEPTPHEAEVALALGRRALAAIERRLVMPSPAQESGTDTASNHGGTADPDPSGC